MSDLNLLYLANKICLSLRLTYARHSHNIAEILLLLVLNANQPIHIYYFVCTESTESKQLNESTSTAFYL